MNKEPVDPLDGLPDPPFNGMEYQPSKDKLKEELDKLMGKVNNPKSGKPPVAKKKVRAGVGVVVPPSTATITQASKETLTPKDFYKKIWNKTLKTLPEWRQKEIDFLFKTGDTENRHYLDFVRLVASTADEFPPEA